MLYISKPKKKKYKIMHVAENSEKKWNIFITSLLQGNIKNSPVFTVTVLKGGIPKFYTEIIYM